MPERRLMLASAIFTIALISALFGQSARSLRAEEECTPKPNSPAPQGQHWYYRTDPISYRQCWHLGPEGLPVQTNASQAEKQLAPDPVAQTATPTYAQQRETTGAAHTETARDAGAPATTRPAPWPYAPKFTDLSSFLQPVPQPAPMEWTRSTNAIDSAPTGSSRVSENVSDPSLPSNTSAPASVSDASPAETRAREPQRSTLARSAVSAPMQAIAAVDHTFALLMVVFALLAVTGPVHHYAEQRRQREANNFQVPQWAHVVALNTPKPHVRLSFAPKSGTERQLAPIALRPPDQTERLAQVLQQLVDRMQMDRRQPLNTVTRSAPQAASRR